MMRALTRSFFSLMALSFVAFTPQPVFAEGPYDAPSGVQTQGLGVERGIADTGNSGLVGTVTLFRQGQKTVAVVKVHGQRPGHSQPLAFYRSHACDAISSTPAFSLSPLVNGYSESAVPVSLERLTSGNYVLAIKSADSDPNHFLACGSTQ